MEATAGDWPATRWPLTAPESYVVHRPERPSSVEAFKLALTELVLRRALAIEALDPDLVLGRRKRRSALRDGPKLGAVDEPALTPLLELYRRAQRGRLRTQGGSEAVPRDFEGVLVEDLAKMARREFTRSLAGYIDRHVSPALAQRGLIRSEEYQRFGLFPRTRRVFTSAGREAADELERWLRIGHERLQDWVHGDPARALAYAGGAGAAVLLMPSLYPELDLLGEHAREQTAAASGSAAGEWPGEGAGAPAGDATDVGVHPAQPPGEVGALDLGAPELDFGAFGGLDGALGALDAGVDAGIGVGGDGGGGGGGNGGAG